MAGRKVIIVPHLAMDSRVHSTIGLSALELYNIDNEIVVLIVEEKLPKSECSITYELILDLRKLSLELCGSLIEKGYTFFLEDKELWIPQRI